MTHPDRRSRPKVPPWKRRVRRVARSLGVEVRAPVVRRTLKRLPEPGEPAAPPGGTRLVASPVFLISSIRSGSTLLRMVLSSHSQLHAPHEMHLGSFRVKGKSRLAVNSALALGWSEQELAYMLWDRMLHRELVRSGKSQIIEKTPWNATHWQRLVECWPQARFIFLLRHPWTVLESWYAGRPAAQSRERALEIVLNYLNAVRDAEENLPGLQVRYEAVTADPVRETKRICAFLGVPWEPGMVAYGDGAKHRFPRGLGDWGEKIRTGRIQPARPLPPGDMPAELEPFCAAWGYPIPSRASDSAT